MQHEHQNGAEPSRPADITERILDIRYDHVFKAVFTKDTPESRGALSHLISALIGHTVAVETTIINEPPIDDINNRRIRFDIACKTTKGRLVNIEMTLHPKADELNRLEFYAAKQLTGQNIHGKGKSYLNLKKSYQLAILANERHFSDESPIHNFSHYDHIRCISLNGKSRIITLELCKTKALIDKPAMTLKHWEAWAAYFENLTKEEKKEKINEILKREEGIAMAHETLMQISRDEEEFYRLLSLEKNILDYQSGMTLSRREGLQQGRIETARNALAKGLSIELIHEITGLSAEEIALL